MTIGKSMKKIREECSLSRQQLSKDTGLSVSSIRGYEIDYNEPGAHALCVLADYYGVSVDELMGRTIK